VVHGKYIYGVPGFGSETSHICIGDSRATRLTRSSEVASLIFCVVNCNCVSVVTRLRAGDRDKRFLSNASELIGCVSVYGRVKLQEREADCSPLSSAEVKSLSIPPFLHVSLLRSLINAEKISSYNLCP
jgi:hypothetical protein